MTTDEKVFFTGLIKGLEGRFDGLEQHLTEHDKRFEQVDKRFGEQDKRFNRLEDWMESNSRGIRHNGMLIEIMQHDIKTIKAMDEYIREMNAKIDAVLESIGIDIPVLQHTVSNHSRRLKALEAKRA